MSYFYIIKVTGISIHALLAESDFFLFMVYSMFVYFYPRSPCGERRFVDPDKDTLTDISIHALLAESDGPHSQKYINRGTFLSTLSLRRATSAELRVFQVDTISIHALLAESDYDTSSLLQCQVKFLSTLSLRRATRPIAYLNGQPHDFYPRSPCGERRVHYDNYNLHCVISIHALLAESDRQIKQTCRA